MPSASFAVASGQEGRTPVLPDARPKPIF
uniref:Uncharacterized protein n=1 Tax=Arundo donax TaxID=35708 RepID=A0A0A9AY88_ARUDO